MGRRAPVRALRRAQRRGGGARHRGALQRRAPAARHRRHRDAIATSCSARCERLAETHGRAGRDDGARRRARSRWTTRSTWACTSGAISPPAIRRRVDARRPGAQPRRACAPTWTWASRPPQVTRERSIWAVDGRVDVSFHTYTDVHIRDFVRGLLRARLRRHRERVRYRDNLPRETRAAGARARGGRLLREVNRFLARPAAARRRRRVGRHAVRRARRAGRARRRLPRAGLLRLDGLRRAGRARRADRHAACGRSSSAATAPSR